MWGPRRTEGRNDNKAAGTERGERSREETASSGPGCLGVFTATLFHEGTCRLFIQ